MSPTNALIVIIRGAAIKETDEIDELLVFSQPLGYATKLLCLIADNHDIGSTQNTIDRVSHQFRNMRYLAFDVFLVGAHEPRERNVAVVNRQLESFANQSFDERHHG